MNHYKIIFIVIASPSDYYNKNKIIMNQFMNKNKNIKTFYIYGNVDKSKVFKTEHDLYFDFSENLVPGILKKSIKSFEYINKNYTYDYLIRTNLSTFWNFKRILQKIKKFPNRRCLAGDIRRRYPINYLFGTGIIYSRDMVNLLVKDKNKLNYDKADDIVLSYYLHKKYGIKYINEPRCKKFMKRLPKNKGDIPKKKSHFRLKTPKERELDHIKMFILHKVFNK
jgi:hypothetical protein